MGQLSTSMIFVVAAATYFLVGLGKEVLVILLSCENVLLVMCQLLPCEQVQLIEIRGYNLERIIGYIGYRVQFL